MKQGYVTTEPMQGFPSGIPSVLALAAIDEGERLSAEQESIASARPRTALTELAIALVDVRLARARVRVRSRRGAGCGAHVAISRQEPCRLARLVDNRDVIVVVRSPDVIRLGWRRRR